MKNIYSLLFVLTLILNGLGISFSADISKNDWLIIPGVRVGPIVANSTHEDLKVFFGDRNVVVFDRNYEESTETFKATKVFPNTDNELEIVWSDKEKFQHPGIISITRPGKWMLKGGVKVGTTLQKLIDLNKGAITFLGFGWDYGGKVQSWKDGSLEALIPLSQRNVSIFLREHKESSDYALTGDKELFSNSVEVSKNFDKIKVGKIQVFFK